MEHKLPTLGFLGTGTLTSALVTGFCQRARETPYPILLSPRSQEKSARLKAAYPDRVEVAASMQEVVDRSDWVMLAVLPGAGEEACRSLCFRPEQKVINFMSDKTLPQIRAWIGETAALVHMVPLTFNASFQGPIVLSPSNREAAEIFGHIGQVIQVEERYHAAVLAAITACAAPFYTLMDTLRQWTGTQGVPEELGAQYVSAFFQAICHEASLLDADGLHQMAGTATPGGINFMVKDHLTRQGGFQMWADAMEPVMQRLAASIPRGGEKM
ncbi:MAG: NAD(P)-binding domain-containing protein [Lawsonibacter sp.]|nr:NAD(P)-binding domain-containing protein [Lawsonibacter sp.]